MTPPRPILLTGATGYIGGRLLTAPQEDERVRCVARRPEFLRHHLDARTAMVSGDVSAERPATRPLLFLGYRDFATLGDRDRFRS